MAAKKKVIATVAAVATSAALLLGGTMAWQSANQVALNEASDVINPGGRLHDDFNGENKDVYVENFADDPIYARVRLEEYFEIITNYGKEGAEKPHELIGSKNDDGTFNYELFYFDGNVDENGVVTAANHTDDSGETTSYWIWQTGGSTVYMPTFNLNKDSLAADVNGIYEEGNVGTISNRFDPDDPQYTEYTDYTKQGVGYEETANEIYDGDANNADEVGTDFSQENLEAKEQAGSIVIVSEDEDGNPIFHTAKETERGSLISMAEWDGTPGPYWVYDTDGWVYWAQAIEPDSATGLLLDGIELNQVMDDTWYYAINVIAQFVTADDVGKSDSTGFYAEDEAPTAEAEELLRTIGVFSVDDEAGESGEDGGDVGYTETLPDINFVYGEASATVYRGVSYTFGNVATGGFPVNPYAAEITTEGASSYVNDDMIIVIDANEPNDTLSLDVTYNGDGGEPHTETVTLTVLSPAEPDDVDTLRDALNNGGVINITDTIETDEEDDDVIPNFDGSTTADYVWTEGGTINGGELVSTSGSSHTLFINNENNWPVSGDGANAATMNGTDITSGSRFAIYAQAVNAPITLNDMNITNNHGGGILAEYTQPITLNNLTVYSASQDNDYAWVNSALAAGMGANVEINGGSYTGTNAVYLLSSGANVTIYDGTFTGELTVENGTLTIYGGTFTVDPTAYVAEGYEVVDNGNGTWSVGKTEVVEQESAFGYVEFWKTSYNWDSEASAWVYDYNADYKAADFTLTTDVSSQATDASYHWIRVYDSNGSIIPADKLTVKERTEENGDIVKTPDENFATPTYQVTMWGHYLGIDIEYNGSTYQFGLEPQY